MPCRHTRVQALARLLIPLCPPESLTPRATRALSATGHLGILYLSDRCRRPARRHVRRERANHCNQGLDPARLRRSHRPQNACVPCQPQALPHRPGSVRLTPATREYPTSGSIRMQAIQPEIAPVPPIAARSSCVPLQLNPLRSAAYSRPLLDDQHAHRPASHLWPRSGPQMPHARDSCQTVRAPDRMRFATTRCKKAVCTVE